MGTLRKDKKEEVGCGATLFQKLDKTIVLQEIRYFDSNQVNPKKCIHILSKILFLLNQGEHLSTLEATTIFFAITKLFQSKDVSLRRLVYLCIKELSSLAQDVIIVTSSLTKDVTGKDDLCRAPAIRTLCSITDSSMLQGIERYMKQGIADTNPAVSSSALVSSLHLSATAPDLVRRWVNEAQEAITSDNVMVSYHALGVVSAIRNDDCMSMVKLITKLLCDPIQSPFAVCLLIRHAAKLLENCYHNSEPYIEFIQCYLRHKSELVVYEALHAIVNLSKPGTDLTQAVSVIQIFCGSSKATLRLAGTRTLAQLTAKYPSAVKVCIADVENLISDSNRTIATLAVTTLLATCPESSVVRLLKQISALISEISDEFKIVVVSAIQHLCAKFPLKQQFLGSYLARMLNESGGLNYKTAIIDAIFALIVENPDAKETGLAHLCEFIEDCEHTTLAIKILHFIGHEGPKARQPSRYIRFIYNRVILESAPVRAAAVCAVARFGAACPDLLPNIQVLLARCESDDDDEVRDRATFYNAILNSADQKLINDYITNVPIPNFDLLEKDLQNHLNTKPEECFDINTVPIVEKIEEFKEEPVQIEPHKLTLLSLEKKYSDQLKVIPYIEKCGPLFKTCEPVELTESETEFRIKCIKHIYARHVILQFECVNTLVDHFLEKVHINLGVLPDYNFICEVPCESLPYRKPGNVFCVLEFPSNPIDSIGSFSAALEFTVYDCDPTTGNPYPEQGYTDSYPLEEIEFGCCDQFIIRPASDDWDATWARAAAAEVIETFVLNDSDAGVVAKAVCNHLGLPECVVKGDTLLYIRGLGMWREGVPIMVETKIVPSLSGVTMQLAVRSPSEEIATLLLAAFE